MISRFINILLAFSVLLFSGCIEKSMEGKMDQLAPQTITLGDAFYNVLKNQDYEGASKLFNVQLSRDNIKKTFEDIFKKHGVIDSINFIGTKFSKRYEDGKTLHLIINTYQVFYSRGFISKQSLKYLVEPQLKRIEYIDGFDLKKYSEESDEDED